MKDKEIGTINNCLLLLLLLPLLKCFDYFAIVDSSNNGLGQEFGYPQCYLFTEDEPNQHVWKWPWVSYKQIFYAKNNLA